MDLSAYEFSERIPSMHDNLSPKIHRVVSNGVREVTITDYDFRTVLHGFPADRNLDHARRSAKPQHINCNTI